MAYSCNECGRAYVTKGSLARHSRNHRNGESEGHTCETCHVLFKRRDLLVRHRDRVHNTADVAIDARARCHTACDSCRVTRTRCDGSQRCSNCVRRRKTCTYTAGSGARMSRQQQPSTLASDDRGQTEGDTLVIPFDDFSALVDHSEAGGLHVSQDMYASQTDDTMTANESLLPSSATTLLDGLSPWPFSMSWQWQHEGHYLSGPASLFDPDEPSRATPDVGSSGTDFLASQTPELLIMNQGTRRAPPGSSLHAFADQVPINLTSVVHEMVGSVLDRPPDPAVWDAFAMKVQTCISFESDISGSQILDKFTDQYFDHFHPLWPMVARQPNLRALTHPLLYLAMTSIGALYSPLRIATQYGSLLHIKLREALLHHSFTTERDALDTGRAILLTQVAALYFEQEGAFSAAQKLSATLCAHAHRMRLFHGDRKHVSPVPANTRDATETLLMIEGRKMLCFGMLRVEAFMSVLFNSKPFVTYEEINLTLPEQADLSDVVGRPNETTGREHTTTAPKGFWFSDLVRIALEEDEILPVLRPMDVEALLFGLQHEIWRFAHDPNLFLRLLKKRQPLPGQLTSQTHVTEMQQDHLDFSRRAMAGLVKDYERVVRALHRWKQIMSQSQMSHVLHGSRARTTYLSGMILYDLSFLRLTAPLESLQQTAYHLESPDDTLLRELQEWATYPEALDAAHYARSIWQNLNLETQRPESEQARYIILVLIALHQAAVVIWAIAGCDLFPNYCLTSDNATDALLRRENTRTLMRRFSDLYPRITKSWGIKSSFAKKVRELADSPFPRLPVSSSCAD